MSQPKEITIGVYERSDGDYEYNIYEGEPNDVGDPIDGGVCTGNLQAAINMACGRASELVQRHQPEPEQELDEIRERNNDKSNNKGITR